MKRDIISIISTIIIASAGIVIMVISWRGIHMSRISQSWPHTEGRIIESRVRYSHHISEHGTSESYIPVVKYTYSIDKRNYENDDISFLREGCAKEKDAMRVIDDYPLGKKVDVFFDPLRPEVSVLKPGDTRGGYSMLYAGLALTILSPLLTWLIQLRHRSMYRGK